jgi:hypothetical protein
VVCWRQLITLVQEPLPIGRGGVCVCVNAFKLIYVSSGQRTLRLLKESVTYERERDVRVGGPAAVIS